MNFKIASYQNRTATVYNYDHSITTIDCMASVALEGGGALSLLQAGGGGGGGGGGGSTCSACPWCQLLSSVIEHTALSGACAH